MNRQLHVCMHGCVISVTDCSFIVKGNHSDDGRFMAYYGAYYGHSHNEYIVCWSIGVLLVLDQ
jgi:hypothetical protein